MKKDRSYHHPSRILILSKYWLYLISTEDEGKSLSVAYFCNNDICCIFGRYLEFKVQYCTNESQNRLTQVPSTSSSDYSFANKLFGKFGSVRVFLDPADAPSNSQWGSTWPEGIKLDEK
jgi:hypothetical protein